MKRPTQAQRLLTYLANHPGASSLEITLACDIVNVTGRVSDLRAAGHPIDCRRRDDGKDGYYIAPRRPVTAGTQEPLW